MDAYDSTADTQAHIDRVRELLGIIEDQLRARAIVHDHTKFGPPEKELFDRVSPKISSTVYGSDEYKAAIAELGPALAHHYALNKHHPEHWPAPESDEIEELRAYIGTLDLLDPSRRWLSSHLAALESRVNGMSLMDITEMLADWCAASQRYKDGSPVQSLEVNRGRFGISDQLYSVLQNTLRELGWIKNAST